MSQQERPNHRSLSDISHLFLSSVREKQMGASALPRRKPPAKRTPSVDLTPEEFKQVLGVDEPPPPSVVATEVEAPETPTQVPPVKVLIASHLGEKQLDAAKRYGRNLAAGGKRVGLIVIDAGEFQLITFDASGVAPAEPVEERSAFDARAMRDAVNELSCDIDCWLLLVRNPRVAEARALLRDAESWVVLSTCDHEGIVACYRAIKGLADLSKSRVSLAALDATEPGESDAVFRKLSGVCGQFLSCAVEPEPAVGEARHVTDVPLMNCQAGHDKAQLASANHWRVVSDLVAQGKQSVKSGESEAAIEMAAPGATPARVARECPQVVEESFQQEAPVQYEKLEATIPMPGAHAAAAAMPSMRLAGMPEVIELSDAKNRDASILAAVMKHVMNEVVECPVRPPMCPEARLAVSRDRRIVLIAVARHGLGELRSIGLAYRWVGENRALLAMALPQFAIDSNQLPHLRLLVDQADVNADVLQPIFQADHVSIHTYRHVRWGERTGLLLDAA